MNKVANGVYPVMITPYTADNRVDYDAVERLTDWYIEKGCHGIFAVCQSSEMFFLTLEEKIKIARRVISRARDRENPISIVCSGHTSDSLEAQAEELTVMHELGSDAVVLVSNRLDQQNEGDATWLRNAEKLLARLPSDIRLGIYECPVPYKRLLTSEILEWCKTTGRFSFIKDTCCDPSLLTSRLQQLNGSGIGLFNANAQTLLHTLQNGAAGFSGIMANFYPELFVWLYEHWQEQPETAKRLQQLITVSEFAKMTTYPVSAKYALARRGVAMTTVGRSVDHTRLNEYEQFCIDQTLDMVRYVCDKLGIDFD